MLRAPGLFFLINSIALILSHPLWTKANATNNGALPSPATQCTPIRGGFLSVVDIFLLNYLPCDANLPDLSFILSFLPPVIPAYAYYSESKKLSTIVNQSVIC